MNDDELTAKLAQLVSETSLARVVEGLAQVCFARRTATRKIEESREWHFDGVVLEEAAEKLQH